MKPSDLLPRSGVSAERRHLQPQPHIDSGLPTRRYAVIALALAALLSAGCTHNMKVKVKDSARIGQPTTTKVPMHVGLMLTTNYTALTFMWDNKMGDKFVYAFGPRLKDNAIGICGQAFAQVTVSTNGVVPAGVDAVLTPEMHKIGYGVGRKLMFTLLTEWTLRDNANRNILWMVTIDATATNSLGKVSQQLFDDLSAKEYRAFTTAPEIQRLSRK
jgi:hypothetical protein